MLHVTVSPSGQWRYCTCTVFHVFSAPRTKAKKCLLNSLHEGNKVKVQAQAACKQAL